MERLKLRFAETAKPEWGGGKAGRRFVESY